MSGNNKSFFDRWMDKKVENVVDTSTDFLSRKFRVYLTAFYLVSMLVFVSYSMIALNNLGKISNTVMIIFGVVFYLTFIVMAVFSIWSMLGTLENRSSKLGELEKMAKMCKILRRILGIVTYIVTIVVLFGTWEEGMQYRLFSCIMLIAFSAGNLWIIVSDIYEKRLQKQLEQRRLAELEAKKNASLKNKMKNSAEKITAGVAAAFKSSGGEGINIDFSADAIKEELSDWESKMLSVLNACYDKAVTGIPKVEEPVKAVSASFMLKYKDIDKAISKYVASQITKCGTSGFVTGLGGLLTLPVAVPANLASVIYMQLRTITTIAAMYGHDPEEEYVRTLAFACLTGPAMAEILESVGIKLGENPVIKMVDSLPIAVLAKINKKICMRFATKAGEKSIASFAKFIPLLGGVIGGTVDAVATRTIADNAKKIFSDSCESTASVSRDESENPDVITINPEDFEWGNN